MPRMRRPVIRRRKRRCPHSNLRPIYGDEINLAGGARLQCRDCGRALDGPVILAAIRAGERALLKEC